MTTHTHLDTHNVKLKFFSFLCSENSITFFYYFALWFSICFLLKDVDHHQNDQNGIFVHCECTQYNKDNIACVCVWPCWKYTQATKVIIIIMNGKFFFFFEKKGIWPNSISIDQYETMRQNENKNKTVTLDDFFHFFFCFQ